MIVRKQIDLKHHIEAEIGQLELTELAKSVLREQGESIPPPANWLVLRLVKTGNGVPIPDDEPVILFRGRDRLALPMLHYYLTLCEKDGCNDFQLIQVKDLINRFTDFAAKSPTMKQPGVTGGL